MKILTVLTIAILTLSLNTAYAEPEKPSYTPEQIKKMPRFSSIENQRCPSARYPSVKNRLACKKEVRIEIYEKRQNRKAS